MSVASFPGEMNSPGVAVTVAVTVTVAATTETEAKQSRPPGQLRHGE